MGFQKEKDEFLDKKDKSRKGSIDVKIKGLIDKINSLDQYFTMCANKTGTLARLSAKLGAIAASASKEQVQAFGAFAEAVGIAFQIQDDILNLKGGIGKDFGEDIREGKMSLPIIKTLSTASKSDKKKLIEIPEEYRKQIQIIFGMNITFA